LDLDNFKWSPQIASCSVEVRFPRFPLRAEWLRNTGDQTNVEGIAASGQLIVVQNYVGLPALSLPLIAVDFAEGTACESRAASSVVPSGARVVVVRRNKQTHGQLHDSFLFMHTLCAR
jgi:hypothetical protein